MWRLKAFCNSKKDNSLADKKKASCCRDGLPFTEEWDRLISKGLSPKEIWETRYEEVNRVNSDFTQKMEFNCENGPKKSMTPSLASAVEHLLLIFGKGYVQEMQGKWEKAQEFGNSGPKRLPSLRRNTGGGGGWGSRKTTGDGRR